MGVLLLTALLALAFFASCRDPQSPAPGPVPGSPEFRGAYDHGGGALVFHIEAPGGGESPLRLVASNLTFDVTSQEVHAQVAIRNFSSDVLRGPRLVLLADFDPTTVTPSNATPLPCPLCIPCPCWPWAYDYQGKYGDDGSLSPGETSAPVEWILHDPDGESFSFRARLQGDEGPRPGTISGSVFADADGDGHRQPFETGIAGAAVTLLHGDSSAGTTTDSEGRFEFQVSEDGLYEVMRGPSSGCDPTTPNHIQVLLVRRPDGSLSGYAGADFGCRGSGPGGQVLVAGMVYEDLNRDGRHQAGEPGIGNVLIDGATPNCPTFAPVQTRTDERGFYRLQLVACAPPYVITRQPLPGYVDTSPNPVVFPGPTPRDSSDVPVPPPGPSGPPPEPPVPPEPRPLLRADFGVARIDSTQESSVEGVVFLDENRNGIREDEERGLPGIAVTASGLECMIPVIGITHTDPMGHYVLKQSDVHCLLPWSVAHAAIDRMCDTSPNPVIVGYDRRPDPRHYRVDFGVAACDSLPPEHRLAIEGVVFMDLNRDGKRDPGEMGVAGAEVQLVSICDVVRATRTDLRGHYRFEPHVVAMCPVQSVHLTAPPFAVYTTPNPAPFPSVPPGQTLVAVDFGVLMRMPPR